MQNNYFYRLIENKQIGDAGVVIYVRSNIECPMNTSMHWHNYNEFEIVTSGKGNEIINGMEQQIERGVAYLLSYTDFHEVSYDENCGEVFEIATINFDDSVVDPVLLSSLRNLGYDPVCKFTDDETAALVKEFWLIKQEIDNPGEFSKEMIRLSLNRVMITYLRKLHAKKKCIYGTKLSPKIQKAVSFIHNNFSRDISLADVAEYVGCSPNYISGLLREEIGSSFGKYLKEIRLRYARSLLNDGNTTVSGVAKLSGFDSVSYFIENYKKYYGETPGNLKSSGDGKENM